MSTSPFKNADGDPDQAPAYIRAMLDLLGDRDPLEVFESTVSELESRIDGRDLETLRTPEASGKWSVVAVLQHLADSEMVVGYRLRVTFSEDNPTIPAYDPDAWADRLEYAGASPEIAIAQLRALRLINMPLWHALTDDDLRRCGQHSERGPESLERLRNLYAAHDLVHLRQIDRILATVG